MAHAQYASKPAGAVQRQTSPAVGGRRKVVPGKSAPVQQAPSDLYYGYEDISKMCARFITALFACPSVPTTSSSSGSSSPATPCPPLANFVAYAIHRTRLPEVVVFTALFLLARLKERFPAARGSSGHRLFISAFMIASKVICDDTYSNKSWCIVGQSLYSLKEVNQMEREMCSYLEWILHVQAPELKAFEDRVRSMYGAEAGANPPAWIPLGSSQSVAQPTLPSPVATAAVEAIPHQPTQHVSPHAAYPSPVSSPPTPSHSDSTSPASSVSCPTPPSSADDPASIAATGSHSSISVDSLKKSHSSNSSASLDPSFAFAAATVW